MDFWKTLLVLLKRWYVALPVFVVSVGAAGAVYATTPMHYESTGTIVLTSPSSGPSTNTAQNGDTKTNPFLAFESSLAISASIVIQSVNTPSVVKELGADRSDHKFVLSGGAEGGPFISVKTESASEPGSRELVVTVLDRVRAELLRRQQALQAPESTFIGVDEVVPPTEPQPLRGGKLRSGGIALVLGLVASLGAVYAVESFSTRRRRGTAAEEPDDTDPATPEDQRDPEPPPHPRPDTPRTHDDRHPVNGHHPTPPHPEPTRTEFDRPPPTSPAHVEPGRPTPDHPRPKPGQGGPGRSTSRAEPGHPRPEPGRGGSGRPTAGRPEPAHPNPFGPEQGEPNRSSTGRPEAARSAAPPFESGQGESVRPSAGRAEAARSAAAPFESGQGESVRSSAGRTEAAPPAPFEASHGGPGRSTGRAEPAHLASTHFEPGQSEPGRSARPEPARPASTSVEPGHGEPHRPAAPRGQSVRGDLGRRGEPPVDWPGDDRPEPPTVRVPPAQPPDRRG